MERLTSVKEGRMNKIEIDLHKLPVDVRKWIEIEIQHSNANDIAVHLLRKRHVRIGGITCNGLFDGFDGRLSVACLKNINEWIHIFAHESCHKDQYIEQIPVWKKNIKLDGDYHDPNALLHEWLEHKRELNSRQLHEVMIAVSQIELDCEIRTAKKIDKFYLPINLKEYIQKANAYIYLYLVIKQTRLWYQQGKSPFNIPAIWTKMPTHFDNDYTRLPTKVKNLILTHSYE